MGVSNLSVSCNSTGMVVLLNGSVLGVTCVSPPSQTVTPKIIPFSVSVLAVVTNNLETAALHKGDYMPAQRTHCLFNHSIVRSAAQ